MSRLRFAAAAAAALTFVTIAPASANDTEKAVAYRQAIFKTFGWHMGQFAAMAKGERDYDAAYAKSAADSMAALGQILGAAFPAGTESRETKSEIWSDPSGFAEAVAAFQKASADFAANAGNGKDAMAGGLRALGGACKGCHDDYRDK